MLKMPAVRRAVGRWKKRAAGAASTFRKPRSFTETSIRPIPSTAAVTEVPIGRYVSTEISSLKGTNFPTTRKRPSKRAIVISPKTTTRENHPIIELRQGGDTIRNRMRPCRPHPKFRNPSRQGIYSLNALHPASTSDITAATPFSIRLMAATTGIITAHEQVSSRSSASTPDQRTTQRR